MNRSVAFSLIELMVVIAIVALLASIAVPAYKSYVTMAKMNSVMPFIEGVKKQSFAYFAENGQFPTAPDLGFEVITNTNDLLDPTTVHPSATAVNVSAFNEITGTYSCNAVSITVQFDEEYFGGGGVAQLSYEFGYDTDGVNNEKLLTACYGIVHGSTVITDCDLPDLYLTTCL